MGNSKAQPIVAALRSKIRLVIEYGMAAATQDVGGSFVEREPPPANQKPSRRSSLRDGILFPNREQLGPSQGISWPINKAPAADVWRNAFFFAIVSGSVREP